MTYYDPDSLAALHTDAATWLGDATIAPSRSGLAAVEVSRALHPASHD